MKNFVKNIVNPQNSDIKEWLLRLAIDVSSVAIILYLTASNFDATEIEYIILFIVLKVSIFIKIGK